MVLITRITINDDTMETLKVIDPDNHDLQYSVFVRPYQNCFGMESEDLGKL